MCNNKYPAIKFFQQQNNWNEAKDVELTQDNCGSVEAFCTVLDGQRVQAELDLRLCKEKDKKNFKSKSYFAVIWVD